MSIYLNANEIFQVGVEIEKNGKLFYETAANQSREETAKKLFNELAFWENQHIDLFETLRRQLPEAAKSEDLVDPDSDLHLYIKATADSHVFVKNKDIPGLVSKLKTPQEVLDLAIQFEKDSVVFYTTIKMAVPEAFGRDRIDALANEEIRHIAILTKEKEKLTTNGKQQSA
jgi:rubrerythrin